MRPHTFFFTAGVLIVIGIFGIFFFGRQALPPVSNDAIFFEQELSFLVPGKDLSANKSITLIATPPQRDALNMAVVDLYRDHKALFESTMLVSFNYTTNELITSFEQEQNIYATNGSVFVNEENKTITYFDEQGQERELRLEQEVQYIPAVELSFYEKQYTYDFNAFEAQAQSIASHFGLEQAKPSLVTTPYFGFSFQADAFLLTVYYDDFEVIGYNILLDKTNHEAALGAVFAAFGSPYFSNLKVARTTCDGSLCMLVETAEHSFATYNTITLTGDSLHGVRSVSMLLELTQQNLAKLIKQYLTYRAKEANEAPPTEEPVCVDAGWRTGSLECSLAGFTCGQTAENGVTCWRE
ncbi:hypothetical protein COT72_03365 [archaeon CG10_big_fil_rev_8_21_14_0_10_43_11]|nr:MAG: hypothetical protein COT72_03365 [archaeon CG10_big_fil_rev_8_21_14_0_10_43_11]